MMACGGENTTSAPSTPFGEDHIHHSIAEVFGSMSEFEEVGAFIIRE